MKHFILKLTLKVLYWLTFKKGVQLTPAHLEQAGWIVDENGFYFEPMVKRRDKVWIQFENHYYRVYHSEKRTFISLESRLEWLQIFLFTLDYHGELKTRKLIF